MILPSISIAMATYNGERFIAAQLDSIRAQTVPPSELIIVDDRSTDKTVEIVEAFARQVNFPVLLTINDEHRGYGPSFMSAANRCTSEIISFCDQDDVWDSEKFELCLPLFADQTVLMVYHNALVVDENLNIIGDLDYLASRKRKIQALEMGPLRHPKGFTSLFRRSLMRLSPYWIGSLNFEIDGAPESHDQFIPFIANVFGCVGYQREMLAKYRRHGANAGGETRWRLTKFDRAMRAASTNLRGWSSMAATFTRRAEILERIATERPEGFSVGAAMRAFAFYRAYAQLYEQRMEIYRGGTFFKRASAFHKIAHNGGYGGDTWSKGLGSAAKDLVRGVLSF